MEGPYGEEMSKALATLPIGSFIGEFLQIIHVKRITKTY